MGLKVKDAAASAAKFATNAQAAMPAYQAGVSNAGGTWQASTAAAAPTWQAGVQQAAANGSYSKSISPAAANKYQTRASTVGPQRYAQGVQGAQGNYQKGVAPYLTVLQNLNLPARQPRGSAANTQRVTAVTQALRAAKLQGAGS